MRVFYTVIALALVLALSCTAAWSAILSWKGFSWDNQPLAPGYTSGTVTVNDYGTPLDPSDDQLWTTSSNVTKNTGFVPYPGWGGEKMSLAKLMWTGAPLPYVRAKVYDPGTAACWQVVLKNSLGNIIDYGPRQTFANGKVAGQLYTAATATWAGNTYIASRYKTGEYWDSIFTPLPDGTVKVDTAHYLISTGLWDYFSWTTPAAFGDIEEVYLSAATSTTIYTTFKWTEFSIPEPSSFLALLSGLPIMGFASRRRK